jgi:hypothetical protein
MNNIKKLTELSLSVYSSFFPAFYLLELTLKNKIYQLLKEELGNDWFKERLKEEKVNSLFSAETELIQKRKPKNFKVSDNVLFLEAGFGFWVEFFNPRIYKLSKGRPIKIFTQLPKEIKRKNLYEKLIKVKDFRNRLYHSRISLITEKSHEVYINESVENYEILLDLLSWLDNPNRDFLKLSDFKDKTNEMKLLLKLL